MVELLVLMFLTGHVGRIVSPKGRSAGAFKFLAVVLWFGGEAVGALIGWTLVGHETVDVYGPALMGACLGAVIAVAIAKGAKVSGLEMAQRNFVAAPSGPAQAGAAKCGVCSGTGGIPCWSCQGKRKSGGLLGIGAKPCKVCSGTGLERCASCAGTGVRGAPAAQVPSVGE
jgi:hypothetical protein